MTKKEQLEIVFTSALLKMLVNINRNTIKWRMENQCSSKVAETVKECANVLLKEVSIRTPLK